MPGWNRGVCPALAGLLAAVAGVLPVTAQATTVSVCAITSLTISTDSPVNPVPTAPTNVAVSAAGSCTGDPSGGLALTASGVTSAPATCEGLVSVNMLGSITAGGSSLPVVVDIAGATAAPLATSQGGLTGTGALSLSPGSLLACLIGGTNVLQYSGAIVFTH